MTFTIYACYTQEVVKKLKKMAKKAEKYGIAFDYSVDDEYLTNVSTYSADFWVINNHPDNTYPVEAVDIAIDCDSLIKSGDWTICAKIEHSNDAGNLVYMFGDDPALPGWYSAPARCEHCNTNRYRATTYIVQDAAGNYKQVGKSCLRDYTGIAPATAAIWATLHDEINNVCLTGKPIDEIPHESRFVDIKYIISHAVDEINENGYIKATELKSTKSETIKRIASNKPATEKAQDTANNIIDWLNSLPIETCKSDLIANCIQLAKNGYCKYDHVGMLCYMPIAYKNHICRKNVINYSEKSSKYVGNVGERITIKTNQAAFVTSFENQYGMTFLYKFIDSSGNVFVWFSSNQIDISAEMTVKGTIKAHNDRNGVKQTVITRCKVST